MNNFGRRKDFLQKGNNKIVEKANLKLKMTVKIYYICIILKTFIREVK